MDHRRFLRYLVPTETVLKAYLLAGTRDVHQAEDLMQDVLSVLWEKFETYDEARPFQAWAIGFARVQVAKWRSEQARSREVVSGQTLELLADTAVEVAEEVKSRGLHLMGCLEWLGGIARQVVQMKYGEALSIMQIAEQLRKSVPATEMILVRARRALQDCVERKLGGMTEAGP